MSNTINRAVIRRLYRALLLEGRKWPHPPSRVQRSLHTHIPAIARNRFREAINEKDPAYIKALASEGALELFALQRLRNNEYFLKFPMRKIPTPRMVLEKQDLEELSDAYQNKQQKRGWGLTYRILRLFLGKGPEG